MTFDVDFAYKSLNKHKEILCGDRVEFVKTKNSTVMILADGMGSGVKANILATMTAKIIGTLFLTGSSLQECVETIVQTLPICQVRKVAYTTFSILQIFNTGEAYLVEFDNPSCIFIRNGKLVEIPNNILEIEGKKINEYRFNVLKDDTFILVSDGAIHAGVGKLLNFGWQWDDLAKYALKQAAKTVSAPRLAADVSQACDELYQFKPGDDTTVACMRIREQKTVHLMTGPAKDKENDEKMVLEFLDSGKKIKRIICGGTSAQIVSRVLERKLDVSLDYDDGDDDVPPISKMEGIDLVTEGVLTLNKTLSMFKKYIANEDVSYEFFKELDRANGASMLCKIIIEECTHLNLYVGKAINSAYQNPNLPLDLAIRQNLVEQFKDACEKMGKFVTIKYY